MTHLDVMKKMIADGVKEDERCRWHMMDANDLPESFRENSLISTNVLIVDAENNYMTGWYDFLERSWNSFDTRFSEHAMVGWRYFKKYDSFRCNEKND